MIMDQLKTLRIFAEKYGYVPTDDCRHMIYPTIYCKDNFIIAFSVWNQFRSRRLFVVVEFRYMNEIKSEHIATTGGISEYRYRNVPMQVMKKAIKNPSHAITIFNNWETEKALQIL